MGTSSRTPERFKYGICLNDECSLCKSKTVQRIPMRKDLVCTECGKPLRETLPPRKKGLGTPVVIIIAVVAIAILFGILWFTGVIGGSDNDTSVPLDSVSIEQPADSMQTDTVANDEIDKVTPEAEEPQKEAAKKEVEVPRPAAKEVNIPSPAPPSASNGTLSLSYGKYTGAIKNGYPNGQGKLVYTTSRQINKYDSKGRIAQPGDYVQGEFVNGFLTIGKHYNAQGELVESINVGVPDDVYEAK